MTVLLDAHVVSAPMRKAPSLAVLAWTAGHRLESLFFSTVGEAELRYGAAILPAGRRRTNLESDIERMLLDAFENRVLPYDNDSACAFAVIAAARRSAGRPGALAECQIAAIARCRGMAVATRNVRDFEDREVNVIDPWTAA